MDVPLARACAYIGQEAQNSPMEFFLYPLSFFPRFSRFSPRFISLLVFQCLCPHWDSFLSGGKYVF